MAWRSGLIEEFNLEDPSTDSRVHSDYTVISHNKRIRVSLSLANIVCQTNYPQPRETWKKYTQKIPLMEWEIPDRARKHPTHDNEAFFSRSGECSCDHFANKGEEWYTDALGYFTLFFACHNSVKNFTCENWVLVRKVNRLVSKKRCNHSV